MDAAFPDPSQPLQGISGRIVWMKESDEQAATPDEAAFERTVAESMPQLLGIAMRLTSNRDLAHEAVQNAIVKAAKAFTSFRHQSEIKTWIVRIVIHCARDALLAEKTRNARFPNQSQEDLDHISHQEKDSSTRPDEQTLASERKHLVQQAVMRLPDRQREVVVLMVWQGLSGKQAAELLELDTQAVHANLYAARQSLKKLLRGFED
ncbi:MAG: RNA polymerase sigma factor [Planctomycetota bacterium]